MTLNRLPARAGVVRVLSDYFRMVIKAWATNRFTYLKERCINLLDGKSLKEGVTMKVLNNTLQREHTSACKPSFKSYTIGKPYQHLFHGSVEVRG